jgi:hypothetical protein
MSTDAVTPLRQRMIEDMNARKLCAGTQRGDSDPQRWSVQRWTLLISSATTGRRGAGPMPGTSASIS